MSSFWTFWRRIKFLRWVYSLVVNTEKYQTNYFDKSTFDLSNVSLWIQKKSGRNGGHISWGGAEILRVSGGIYRKDLRPLVLMPKKISQQDEVIHENIIYKVLWIVKEIWKKKNWQKLSTGRALQPLSMHCPYASYWKWNFPMTRPVPRSVGRSVGRSIIIS